MKMILLTQEQADQVKGKYGEFDELQPIEVVEGFALPLNILDNSIFDRSKNFLLSLPQEEVTFLPPTEILKNK